MRQEPGIQARGATMKRSPSLVIAAAMMLSFSQVHAQRISEKTYQEMVDSTYRSCFHRQRGTAENASLTDEVIRAYCSCFAREINPRDLTVQELEMLAQIAKEQGGQAMLPYVLKGRDINVIAAKCVPD